MWIIIERKSKKNHKSFIYAMADHSSGGGLVVIFLSTSFHMKNKSEYDAKHWTANGDKEAQQRRCTQIWNSSEYTKLRHWQIFARSVSPSKALRLFRRAANVNVFVSNCFHSPTQIEILENTKNYDNKQPGSERRKGREKINVLYLIARLMLKEFMTKPTFSTCVVSLPIELFVLVHCVQQNAGAEDFTRNSKRPFRVRSNRNLYFQTFSAYRFCFVCDF